MIGSSHIVEILAGATEPVTLERVKEHLRVDFPDDDDLISAYISAARRTCEDVLYTALVPQRRRALFDGFSGRMIFMGPLIAIESVRYTPAGASAPVDLPVEEYRAVSDVAPYVEPAAPLLAWPQSPVEITYTCGPTEGVSPLSPTVAIAILLKVGDMYENRADPIHARSSLSDNMLRRERVQTFG